MSMIVCSYQSSNRIDETNSAKDQFSYVTFLVDINQTSSSVGLEILQNVFVIGKKTAFPSRSIEEFSLFELTIVFMEILNIDFFRSSH